MQNFYGNGLQIIGKWHIIPLVLESQALLIFLKIIDEGKLKRLKITVDMKVWICYYNLVATTQCCEWRIWSLKTEQWKVITSKEVNISQSAGFT